MTRVTREALFRREAVERLLSVAEAGGGEVWLAKDEGAYLMAHHADGSVASEAIVYAEGHRPPPRPARPELGAEDPWIRARRATEQVWGGDDFSERYPAADIRALLGPAGIRAVVELDCFTPPPDLPAGPWGRDEQLCHADTVTLTPA